MWSPRIVWSEEVVMSSFFKQLFPFMKVKKKKEFSYIIKGVDPNTVWDLVGELGDGSFGKVYKVISRILTSYLYMYFADVFYTIFTYYTFNYDLVYYSINSQKSFITTWFISLIYSQIAVDLKHCFRYMSYVLKSIHNVVLQLCDFLSFPRYIPYIFDFRNTINKSHNTIWTFLWYKRQFSIRDTL